MAETIDLKTPHYPDNGKYSFLNLAVGVWLEERIAYLEEKKIEKNLARYKAMNPDWMMMEPPIIFKKGYVITNVLDRMGGLLVLDQKVKLVKFDTFLKRANKSKVINPSAKENSPFSKVIADETDWSTLIDKLKETDTLSTTPIYWLTKNKEDGHFHVLFDGKDEEANFDLFVEWIVDGYSFEKIKLTESEPTSIDGFSQASCGAITIEDKMLVEKKINMNFINLNAIKKLIV